MHAIPARAFHASWDRSMMELDPTKTLWSIEGIDGIGFSTTSNGSPCWRPSTKILTFRQVVLRKGFHVHVVRRRGSAARDPAGKEGGEQGDPLMPALYVLGQHAALTQVHATLRQGERILTTSLSSATLLELQRFSSRLSSRSSGQLTSKSTLGRPRLGTVQPLSLGIQTPLAPRRGQVRDKSRIEGLWCWECPWPQSICAEVVGRQRAVMRSFSVGSQLSKSARLLLLMCAEPRAHHILRNLPPSEVSQLCQDHDNRLWECLVNILAVEVPDDVASEVVQLPCREGGLGLRSAARLAPAACWASLADCLSQVYARAPHVLLEEQEPPSRAQCVREAQDAATLLAREVMEVLEWSRFPVADFRAPQPVDPEVGEWTHGTHQLLGTPFLQLACTCHLHRPPSFAGIATRSLCFAPLQLSTHMSGDHIFG